MLGVRGISVYDEEAPNKLTRRRYFIGETDDWKVVRDIWQFEREET